LQLSWGDPWWLDILKISNSAKNVNIEQAKLVSLFGCQKGRPAKSCRFFQKPPQVSGLAAESW
jgi:hypothetical protein